MPLAQFHAPWTFSRLPYARFAWIAAVLGLLFLGWPAASFGDDFQLVFTMGAPGAFETSPAVYGADTFTCFFAGCFGSGIVTGSDDMPKHPGGSGIIAGGIDSGLAFSSGKLIGSDATHKYFDPTTGFIFLYEGVCFVTPSSPFQNQWCVGQNLPSGDASLNVNFGGSSFPIDGKPAGTPTLTFDGNGATFTMDFYNSVDPRIEAWFGLPDVQWVGKLSYECGSFNSFFGGDFCAGGGVTTIVDTPVPEPTSLYLFLTAIFGAVPILCKLRCGISLRPIH
jgi:hypothetical protein